MIHDIKEKPILQVSSQEPSTSSKYGLQEQEVLDTLLIMLESWNFAHKLRTTCDDDPWHQGWPNPPSIESGTINIPQVWTLRMEGSWHTCNHARELKFATQVKNHILWWYMISRMTSSSKYPFKNHQSPPMLNVKIWKCENNKIWKFEKVKM